MPAMIEDSVWAGSEAALQAAIKSEEARDARIAAGHGWGQAEDDDPPPRLLEVHDGVGFVSIKGVLNNSADAWWNEYVGATGYPELREAMVAAAQDPEVNHIILDIDSGGGSVAGLADTSNLIRMVHDRVKPVTAFAGGNMYSAAYWLGASAGKVYATEGSGVGSIGVIATHMERSKMLEEMGIGVNVIRAGKYKALANSVEPLSEEGRKQIQAGVDAAYKIFIGHVSAMRGKSVEYVDSVMAQGREFYGQAGVDAALVDGLTTFDALVSEVKEKFIDASKNSMHNRDKQAGGMGLRVEHQGDAAMAGKKMLTEADITALAAGVTLEAGTAESVDDAAQGVEAQVEDVPAAQAAVEQVAEVDTSAQTIKFVSDQLKAATDDLLAARIALAKSEDKVAELAAVVDPLKAIVAKATNNMRVACRASSMDLSAMNAAQVLAEHQAILPTFASQYKVGGVSAADAAKEVKNECKVDGLTQARLNAVHYSK